THAPPPPPPDVVARRVETFEEYARASEVQWQAFEVPEAQVAEGRELLPQSWRDAPRLVHAAWLDGEIVGAGSCAETVHGLLLYGGATLPRARGRGTSRGRSGEVAGSSGVPAGGSSGPKTSSSDFPASSASNSVRSIVSRLSSSLEIDSSCSRCSARMSLATWWAASTMRRI